MSVTQAICFCFLGVTVSSIVLSVFLCNAGKRYGVSWGDVSVGVGSSVRCGGDVWVGGGGWDGMCNINLIHSYRH